MSGQSPRSPLAETAGQPSDAQLVGEVLGGRKERFALLVRRHQDSLFRHARGMGLDPDTAADMVQDALVKAYESLDGCQDPGRFGFWVGRILRNRCLDHLKSAATQRNTPLHPGLPAMRGNPERHQETGTLREALESALEALPLEQREGFLLKHVEGRSYEELAELAGASVSAVKMRVHRAREFLREHLAAAGVSVGM
jgi:RNA polymerase sigma-70 factor, ECF subfamily